MNRIRPGRWSTMSIALAALLSAACAANQSEEAEAPVASAAEPTTIPGMIRIPVEGPTAAFEAGPSRGSLSPDGRWIALSRTDVATGGDDGLWLLPAVGGAPQRLTDAGPRDRNPAWAATGDRIYFESSRPSRGGSGSFVMALDVDPATGRAKGVPRQVTLEPQSLVPSPSPDGQLVAYRVAGRVRVVPANGGTSRVITETRAGQQRLEWETDGSAIYFVQREPQGAGLFRVPVSGGAPTLVHQFDGNRGIAAISPRARLILTTRSSPGDQEGTLEVFDFDGRLLKSQVVPSPWVPLGFSADGTAVLGAASDVGATVRVRSIAGDETVDLKDTGKYGLPLGWTPDSKAVIVDNAVESGPNRAFEVVPIDGTAARLLPLAPEAPEAAIVTHYNATATHIAYMVTPPAPQLSKLYAVDLASGERTLITASTTWGRRGTACCGSGPGGLYSDGDGILYTEVIGPRVEFRSWRAQGGSRTLHSVPIAEHHGGYAFHGGRVAYRSVVGDSLAVMIAEAGRQPRVLVMLGGRELTASTLGGVSGAIAFSFDGRRLAIGQSAPRASEVLIVDVPAQGRSTDIRRVQVDGEYWFEPRWLPDGSGFTAIVGMGNTAEVALIPVTPGQPVRYISHAEHQPTWEYHVVSPDGRWVAYAAEVIRPTTLWRVDLKGLSRGE